MSAEEVVANMMATTEKQLAEMREVYTTLGYYLESIERDVKTNREILVYWGWPEGEADR